MLRETRMSGETSVLSNRYERQHQRDLQQHTSNSGQCSSGVAVSGYTVELTVTRLIPSWHAVSVAYSDPSSSNDNSMPSKTAKPMTLHL